jgi:AAA family ATP:ADP antiporter
MFFCVMASTFVLRPVREQFGVDQGVSRLPHLYLLTLGVTVVFTPLFWWLARRMPSRRFVPIALHAFAASMVGWWLALSLIHDFDWKSDTGRLIGESFWGFLSAFNVAAPTLVWIHVVEHFRRDQGRRLFGLIGVGGTLGAVVGPQLAGWLTQKHRPASNTALAALVLLEGAFACYLASHRACTRIGAAGAPRSDDRGRGSGIAALALLLRRPRLLAIGGYMVLLGMVATAFAVAQTQLVGEQVVKAGNQMLWFADVESLTQGLALVLQVSATGHLLRRFPQWSFLCLLPLLAVCGLFALWLFPVTLAVGIVQVLRRGGQFAFEKPARELLYTPFDLETKHKVKFLLDTVAFRLGDLLGAHYQVALREHAPGPGVVLLATVALAVLWAVLGVLLGRHRAAAAVHALA